MRAALVLCCAILAAPAGAQEQAGHVYVAAGGAAVSQDGLSGESSQTYVTAPGGTTLGWSVAGGVFLARHVSVEGEFTTTGTMSAREPSRYGMTFNEERRDRFLWGAVRTHAPLGTAVDIEPLAGFGFVSTQTTSQTERAPCVGCPGPIQVDPKVTDTVPARYVFVFGCDARIGGAHLALVPSFRVMRAGAYPDWPTYYPGGVSLTTFSAGASVRATF